MKVRYYDGYEIHVSAVTNKVFHAITETESGFVMVRPYKYDSDYNCWTNVSGVYTLGYLLRLYREGEIIFR